MTYVPIWGVRLAVVAAEELVGRRWARSWEQEGDGGRLPLRRRKGGERPDHSA